MSDPAYLLKALPLTSPADGDQIQKGAQEIRVGRVSTYNYVTVGHTEDGVHLYGVATGTADALVVEVGVAPGLLALGLITKTRVTFKASLSNATTTPTLAVTVNSSAVGTAKTILLAGAPIPIGTLRPNYLYEVIFDGTYWQLVTGIAGGVFTLQKLVKKTPDVASVANTVSIPYDESIPQSDEGTEIMHVIFTPQSATSKIYVRATVPVGYANNDRTIVMACFVYLSSAVTAQDAVAAVSVGDNGANSRQPIVQLECVASSPGTAATRVSLRMGNGDAQKSTIMLNGNISGDHIFSTAGIPYLEVQEVVGSFVA